MTDYADRQSELEEHTHAGDNESTIRRYKLMAKALPEDFAGEVLEMACARGLGGATFKQERPNVKLDGSDLLQRWLDEIPEGIYRDVHCGLAQELAKERPEAYDAILAGELIEHVPYDQLEGFVHGVRDLLRPGGVFLLTTPNPHYIALRLGRGGGSVLGGAHVSVHCPTALTQYLQEHGFKVTKIVGSGRMTKYLGGRAPKFLYGAYHMAAVRVK